MSSKKIITKYLLNLKEESSIRFPQIMKDYIKKLFSPKTICQRIIKSKYYTENCVFNYLNFKILLSTKS